MIEVPKSILLPPQSAAPSGPAGQARAGGTGLPVPVVAPVPPAPAEDGRDPASLPDWRRRTAGGGAVEDDTGRGQGAGRPAAGRGAILLQGRRAADAFAGPAAQAAGAAAFMAQQIFQEAMSTGLHLEPWTQGIGAYRRAGAEPPLASAGPAVFSLAV